MTLGSKIPSLRNALALPLAGVLALMLGLADVAPAQAQLARTYVSSLGNDANDCNRPTPCRTFQHAHDQTLANGEITVLDPGGYGAVTITKALSIINDGVGEAGVLVSGGVNGVTINAPATDAVSLRGLTIKGIGFGGGNGIVFSAGKSLSVENCVVRNLNGTNLGTGIMFQPGAGGSLKVTNTLVAENGGVGIFVSGNGGTTAVLTRVELSNNLSGFIAFAGTNAKADVTVTESIANNHGLGAGGFGFNVQSSGGSAVLNLNRSVASYNGLGLSAAGAGALVRVGQSVVTGNTAGWEVFNSGSIMSYFDNYIDGNGGNEGALPAVQRK